jgi:hypothetical protein
VGGPTWLTGVFAALMLTVAVYCASRLAIARRWRRPTDLDTDGTHVVMGVAMAGMLTASLRIFPAVTWEPVFGGAAAWFAWRVVRVHRGAPASPWRCAHPLPHLVECGAMLFMLAVVPVAVHSVTGGGMGGMTGAAGRFSVVALALTVFLLGYVVWVGDRLTSPAMALASPAVGTAGDAGIVQAHAQLATEPSADREPSGVVDASAACRPVLAPRCAALCKIAMGVTMGYMLVLML